MNRRQAGYLNLAVSFVFAIVMIAVPKLFNFENTSAWIMLPIALWFVPYITLLNWRREPDTCDNLHFICRSR